MLNNLGLTDAEYFRYYNTLPPDRIESLIEGGIALDQIKGAEAHIQEARAQYPDEDFLEGVADVIREVAANVRGQNKAQLQHALEMLDDIAQMQLHASDYGRDELRKLEKLIA